MRTSLIFHFDVAGFAQPIQTIPAPSGMGPFARSLPINAAALAQRCERLRPLRLAQLSNPAQPKQKFPAVHRHPPQNHSRILS